MNAKRRKLIDGIVERLEAIYVELEELGEEEREAFDNMPQWFQDGEKWEEMTRVADCIEAAVSLVEEAKDSLEESVNS